MPAFSRSSHPCSARVAAASFSANSGWHYNSYPWANLPTCVFADRAALLVARDAWCADPTAATVDGNTALVFAAMHGHWNVIDALLRACATAADFMLQCLFNSFRRPPHVFLSARRPDKTSTILTEHT
mgnify:CR=1 FL=1